MTKQKRFTVEFKAEAVRLALSGERSQRAVADDLGIGYSTLDRWIGRHRDTTASIPVAGESSEDELKRLRRENHILREEREILKKATAFFAKEGNR